MTHASLGWIGSFLFAICALPQAIKVWQTRSSGDLSWLFLWLWLLGELFTVAYLVVDDVLQEVIHWPLYINYGGNTIIVLYLLYAKRAYPKSNH